MTKARKIIGVSMLVSGAGLMIFGAWCKFEAWKNEWEDSIYSKGAADGFEEGYGYYKYLRETYDKEVETNNRLRKENLELKGRLGIIKGSE